MRCHFVLFCGAQAWNQVVIEKLVANVESKSSPEYTFIIKFTVFPYYYNCFEDSFEDSMNEWILFICLLINWYKCIWNFVWLYLTCPSTGNTWYHISCHSIRATLDQVNAKILLKYFNHPFLFVNIQNFNFSLTSSSKN